MVASVEVSALGRRSIRYNPKHSMLLMWGMNAVSYPFEVLLTEGSGRSHPPVLMVDGAVSICRLHPDRAIPVTRVSQEKQCEIHNSDKSLEGTKSDRVTENQVLLTSDTRPTSETSIHLEDWSLLSVAELSVRFKHAKGSKCKPVLKPKIQRSPFR